VEHHPRSGRCNSGRGPKSEWETFSSEIQQRCASRLDDAGRQDAWFKLVRNLKQMYPNNDTLGERIKLYVDKNFPDA
jgi:hypothetical protein